MTKKTGLFDVNIDLDLITLNSDSTTPRLKPQRAASKSIDDAIFDNYCGKVDLNFRRNENDILFCLEI